MVIAKKQPKTVDRYIATFPSETQEILHKLRKLIQAEIPNAEEGISYSIAVYKLNGKYVVYFGAWKKHISLYPVPHDLGELRKEVARFQTGRGTLKFPLDRPLPFSLIRKVVKLLVKESQIRLGKY